MDTKGFEYLFGTKNKLDDDEISFSSLDSVNYHSMRISTFYIQIIRKPIIKRKILIQSLYTLCVWRILTTHYILDELENEFKQLLNNEVLKIYNVFEDVDFKIYNYEYDDKKWKKFADEVFSSGVLFPLKKIEIDEDGELIIINL